MHNIVYITDDNYVLPTKTSINSIVQNITDTEICVNVICVEVTEKNQQAIKNLASKNIKINILNFGNDYNDLGLSHIYVSKAALFKFQIPLVFKDLDKILYVDGDMIFSQEFPEIFNFDISEKYAAVVQDLLATCFEKWNERLGHKKYFNSGMMYLNLKKMREDSITEKLIEYKKNDKEDHFMDQNALNAVIGNNCLWISPKFNMMATCNSDSIRIIYGKDFSEKAIANFYEISELEMKSAWQVPAILHVTSETKVWKNTTAKRINDWIPFVKQEDYLKVTKNWFDSLSADFSQKLENHSRSITNLEENHQSFESKINLIDKSLQIFSENKLADYQLSSNAIADVANGVDIENFYETEEWGRWTIAPCCSVTFRGRQVFKTGRYAKLCFAAHSFHSSRTVKISFNGFVIADLEISTSSEEYKISLPFDKISQSKNRITFSGDGDFESPKEVGVSDDERKLFIAFKYIYIENPLFERTEANSMQLAVINGNQEVLESKIESVDKSIKDFSENKLSDYQLSSNAIADVANGVDIENFYETEEWGRWTIAPECSVTFRGNQISKAGKHAKLCFEASAFASPRTVKISLNGFVLSDLEISASYEVHEIILPFDKISQVENKIVFTGLGDFKSPKELGLNVDERNLFIAFRKIYIENPLFERTEKQEERLSEQVDRLSIADESIAAAAVAISAQSDLLAKQGELIERLQRENADLKKLVMFTKNHTLWGVCARIYHKIGKIIRRR